MKLFPTLFAYNAPLRGPKNYRDLNKVITGINYDLESVRKVNLQHEVDILTNNYYITEGIGESISDIPQAGVVNDEAYNYCGTEDISSQLNYINNKLDNMLKKL